MPLIPTYPHPAQSGAPPLPLPETMLRMLPYLRDPNYRQWMGSAPRGLLDQRHDVTPMLPGGGGGGYGLLGQNVGAVIDFPQGGRGLLGMRQGTRGEGGGGQVVQMPQKAAPQGNPYFGKYSNQPPASMDSAILQQQHMAKVEAATKKLPSHILEKIDHFSEKHGASPYVRGNTIIDAAEMKAARQSWESYSGKNPDIMPPGMQYPQGKPPGGGMQLVEDAKAWMNQTGKLPFDSKVLSDRFNKLPVDQREIFNRIMFPQDYNK